MLHDFLNLDDSLSYNTLDTGLLNKPFSHNVATKPALPPKPAATAKSKRKTVEEEEQDRAARRVRLDEDAQILRDTLRESRAKMKAALADFPVLATRDPVLAALFRPMPVGAVRVAGHQIGGDDSSVSV